MSRIRLLSVGALVLLSLVLPVYGQEITAGAVPTELVRWGSPPRP
jgi:hypothetical protein